MGLCGSSEANTQDASNQNNNNSPAPVDGNTETQNVPVDLSNVDISQLTDEQIEAIELGFFKRIKQVDTTRDYTIIVDKSGSMSGSRWVEAKNAVAALAPAAVRCDPDGITLYFFSDRYTKYENVTSSDEVMRLFKQNSPDGMTDLATVLEDAVKPDTPASDGSLTFGRPETILVITDGTPNDKQAVERVIIEATNKYMRTDNDLSISFIQIGNDMGADSWLQALDDELQSKGAKFDAVDRLTASEMHGLTFEQVIAKSVTD